MNGPLCRSCRGEQTEFVLGNRRVVPQFGKIRALPELRDDVVDRNHLA